MYNVSAAANIYAIILIKSCLVFLFIKSEPVAPHLIGICVHGAFHMDNLKVKTKNNNEKHCIAIIAHWMKYHYTRIAFLLAKYLHPAFARHAAAHLSGFPSVIAFHRLLEL